MYLPSRGPFEWQLRAHETQSLVRVLADGERQRTTSDAPFILSGVRGDSIPLARTGQGVVQLYKTSVAFDILCLQA